MSEEMKMDAERAAFEAWAEENGHYKFLETMFMAWQARASLPVGVPDGYALVPVEPTPDMQAAALRHVVRQHTLRDVWKDMLAAAPAAPTVKAEQVQCQTAGCIDGVAERGWKHCNRHQFYALREPSLPAAGSAVEEVGVVAWMNCGNLYLASNYPGLVTSEPLMTVAQHKRIVAALSAQQSAPERVSVPREALRDVLYPEQASLTQWSDSHKALSALLSRNGNGGEA